MSNKIPVELNGVVYYIDTTTDTIVDIDVAPGVKTVCFTKTILDRDVRYIKIKSEKSFPDVETLFIGRYVSDLNISNELFPNIKHVTSRSSAFVDNTNILIYRNYQYNNILLNVFCKKPGEIIDLEDVTDIEKNAFSGSETDNIINANRISINDLFQSGYEVKDEITGVKIFDNMLFEINQNAEIVELPDDRFTFEIYNALYFTQNNKCIKIHRYETLEKLATIDIPEHIIIEANDEGLFNDAVIHECSFSCIEINGNNTLYTTIDGALYSKDGKLLIRYPNLKEGKAIIPDGVERIADLAFEECIINSVVMPETLKYIGKKAFTNCIKLQEVKFNRDLEFIGNDAFIDCQSLKKIEIPRKIRSINNGCFHGCPLESIILPEGLQFIGESAFNLAKGSITLPESVSQVDPSNFSGVNVVTIKGSIPHGLLPSIMYDISDNIVEIRTPKGKFYLPKIFKINIDWLNNAYMLPLESIKSYISNLFKELPINKKNEEVTLEMYEKTYDKTVGEVLRSMSKKMIQRLLEDDKNEEMLIRVVKTNILSPEELQKLLEIVQEQEYEMTAAAAYILKQINGVRPDNILNL